MIEDERNEWVNKLEQSLVTATHTGNVYKGPTHALPHGSVPKTVGVYKTQGEGSEVYPG